MAQGTATPTTAQGLTGLTDYVSRLEISYFVVWWVTVMAPPATAAARRRARLAAFEVSADSQDSVLVGQRRGYRKCSTVQPQHVIHQQQPKR